MRRTQENQRAKKAVVRLLFLALFWAPVFRVRITRIYMSPEVTSMGVQIAKYFTYRITWGKFVVTQLEQPNRCCKKPALSQKLSWNIVNVLDSFEKFFEDILQR